MAYQAPPEPLTGRHDSACYQQPLGGFRRRFADRADGVPYMVPGMDAPSIEPRPEIRGPLVSLLTQFYNGDEIGDVISISDAPAAIIDLAYMFVAYVAETEAVHGGDFREFLQRQALEPFLDDDEPPGPT